jgi:hypothetical protein
MNIITVSIETENYYSIISFYSFFLIKVILIKILDSKRNKITYNNDKISNQLTIDS